MKRKFRDRCSYKYNNGYDNNNYRGRDNTVWIINTDNESS